MHLKEVWGEKEGAVCGVWRGHIGAVHSTTQSMNWSKDVATAFTSRHWPTRKTQRLTSDPTDGKLTGDTSLCCVCWQRPPLSNVNLVSRLPRGELDFAPVSSVKLWQSATCCPHLFIGSHFASQCERGDFRGSKQTQWIWAWDGVFSERSKKMTVFILHPPPDHRKKKHLREVYSYQTSSPRMMWGNVDCKPFIPNDLVMRVWVFVSRLNVLLTHNPSKES